MTQQAKGLARAHDSTLVVLDMQTRAAAALQPPAFARVCETTARILRAAEVLAVPVIYTEHGAPSLGVTDPRIVNALPGSAYRVIKSMYCAWADDGFCNAVEIAARKQIILCGLQAHVGIVQTAIALAENNYRVFVVADGIGSHDPALTANAVERMRANTVTITSCESLLYEWTEGSDATSREHILSILHET